MNDYRAGIGVDAHAFAEGVPLVLGGIEIPSPRGLAGHSDGDVIAHALLDAILGAAGLDDIGAMFPSGDEQWSGISSLELLFEHRRGVLRFGVSITSASQSLRTAREVAEACWSKTAAREVGSSG